MSLSKPEIDRVVAVLKTKGIPRACEACGQNHWTLLSELVQLSATRTPHNLPHPSLPCVALTCDNCGNVRLHAITIIGMKDLMGGNQ